MSFEFPGNEPAGPGGPRRSPKGKSPPLFLLLIIGAVVIFFFNSQAARQPGNPGAGDIPQGSSSDDVQGEYPSAEHDRRDFDPLKQSPANVNSDDWGMEDVDPVKKTTSNGEVELRLNNASEKETGSGQETQGPVKSGDWEMDTDSGRKSGGQTYRQ